MSSNQFDNNHVKPCMVVLEPKEVQTLGNAGGCDRGCAKSDGSILRQGREDETNEQKEHELREMQR